MSQFRVRTSSASKSTQTESKIELRQNYAEEEEEYIAVIQESDCVGGDKQSLSAQDSVIKATQSIAKNICTLNNDENDDGLVSLTEETTC